MTAYDIEPKCIELAAAALEGTRLTGDPRLIEELGQTVLGAVRQWIRVEYHNRELSADDHARRVRRDAAAEVPRRLR
jgi:hypothetical protein